MMAMPQRQNCDPRSRRRETAPAPRDIDIVVDETGTLSWGGNQLTCAVGAGGLRREKQEGDGATPIGQFPLRRVLYRPDRLPPPRTSLPISPLTPRDGWCDDPDDPRYNQPIRQPYSARYEMLWRSDHVYDVIVVLGYNDGPIVPGLGSAVFMHIAKPDLSPTEGCIALSLTDLLKVLEGCDPCAHIVTRLSTG